MPQKRGTRNPLKQRERVLRGALKRSLCEDAVNPAPPKRVAVSPAPKAKKEAQEKEEEKRASTPVRVVKVDAGSPAPHKEDTEKQVKKVELRPRKEKRAEGVQSAILKRWRATLSR